MRTKFTTVVEGSFEISGMNCELANDFKGGHPSHSIYIHSRRTPVTNNANSLAPQVDIVIPPCRMPRVPAKGANALDILRVCRGNEPADRMKYNLGVTLGHFARSYILHFETVSLHRCVPLGMSDQVSQFRVRFEFVLVPEVRPIGLYFRLARVVRRPVWVQLSGQAVPMNSHV